MINEYSYWMALAHLPRNWTIESRNKLIINILKDKNINLSDFFNMKKVDWINEFNIDKSKANDIQLAKTELPNYSFLIEDFLNQGLKIIPINSKKYSKTLKDNLRIKNSPPILYCKGNLDLLNESSIAIVGSRKASEKSLDFTNNVAKKAVENYEVVVSGFAKGVDRTALDKTLEAHGRSIIVLPQGIMTFASGFKKYYRQVIDGDVLIVSTFHPNAKWSVGLAMSRNIYIYGLANKIYAAESDSKGGTWTGALDGIKRGRNVYIRYASEEEKNSNNKLISEGGIAVDINGNEIETNIKKIDVNNLNEQGKLF